MNIISTEPSLLSCDLPSLLTTSPSVTTFLPDEEASTCPLLPAVTPSPPPMDFIHPLTPSTGNDENGTETANDDLQADSSSSGSSSGINIQAPFNKYHHLGNNGDFNMQENNSKQNGVNGIKSKKNGGMMNWNWPFIRKCSFFFTMTIIIAMISIVVALIVKLPRYCNPRVAWYKGSVFYEIFPASYQDSNGDGLGDLKGIALRADYLKNMSISAVRLNSIFKSTHYPDHFQNVTTLFEIDEVLGTNHELTYLSATLHARNMSLVLDLPIFPLIKQLDPAASNYSDNGNSTQEGDISKEFLRMSRSLSDDNIVTNAIRFWLSKGVDGFYIKGLEKYNNDPYLLDNVREWKHVLGSDRILIVNSKLFENMDKELSTDLKKYIDLIDVYLDITNGTQYIAKQITNVLENTPSPGFGPWIHWSLGGVEERRLSKGMSANTTLAATLLQLMLPGTPSIFYGDEISLQEVSDPSNDHAETKHMHHLSSMAWNTTNKFTSRTTLPWLPNGASASFQQIDFVSRIITVRDRSPAIYENSIIRDQLAVINTAVRYSRNDVLILERWYPRRNSFVAVSNFGPNKISLDLSAMFYSGEVQLGDLAGEQIFFSTFVMGPMETLIVKLDK